VCSRWEAPCKATDARCRFPARPCNRSNSLCSLPAAACNPSAGLCNALAAVCRASASLCKAPDGLCSPPDALCKALDAACSRGTGLFAEIYTKQALFTGLTASSGGEISEYAAPLVAACKGWPRWPCASTKNLDSVWVWLYKGGTPMALENVHSRRNLITTNDMNIIWEMIRTPQFLIGTIVAGILVNVISHWLISRFPQKFKNWTSSLSTKWQTRTRELREAKEKRIASLIDNPQEQQFLVSMATCKRIGGLMDFGIFLFVGLFAFGALYVLANDMDSHRPLKETITCSFWVLISGILTLVTFQSAVNQFEEAANMVQDVTEARKRKKLRIN